MARKRDVTVQLTLSEARNVVRALLDWIQYTTPEKFGWEATTLAQVGRAAAAINASAEKVGTP